MKERSPLFKPIATIAIADIIKEKIHTIIVGHKPSERFIETKYVAINEISATVYIRINTSFTYILRLKCMRDLAFQIRNIIATHSINKWTINTISGEKPNLRKMYEVGRIAIIRLPTVDSYSLIFPVAFTAMISGLAIELIQVVRSIILTNVTVCLGTSTSHNSNISEVLRNTGMDSIINK